MTSLSLPLETAFRIQGPAGSPNGGMTPNPLSENGTRSRLQTSACVPINRTPQVTVTPARPGSCSPLHLPTSGGPRGQKTPGLDVLTPPHKLLGSACELPSPLPSLGAPQLCLLCATVSVSATQLRLMEFCSRRPPWLASENDPNPRISKSALLDSLIRHQCSPKLSTCSTFQTYLKRFSGLHSGDGERASPRAVRNKY